MKIEEKVMIDCRNLVRIYKTKEVEVVALQGLDLKVHAGELTAIVGKSGSGKSTLLNIIAGLDRPSAGKIEVAGKDLLSFSKRALEIYNRETIGFVWQNNARNLIPYLSAVENVEVPMLITNKKNRRRRALELLDLVGLGHRTGNKLTQLSGGEQQRVAIAIGLANDPKLLLADEPTGAVDEATTYQIMELFHHVNAQLKNTILLVTHDLLVAKMVNRVIQIQDGMIDRELISHHDYEERLNAMRSGTNDEVAHTQYAIIDKKGRLRIPDDLLETLLEGTSEKVALEWREGGILIKKVFETLDKPHRK